MNQESIYIILGAIAIILITATVCFFCFNKKNRQQMPAQKTEKGITAEIRAETYGFKVHALLNGADLGNMDNKSGTIKFYTKDNKNFNQAAPDEEKNNFILKNGENELEVSYQRIDGSTEILDIQLIALEPKYSKPIVSIIVPIVSKKEGRIKQKFYISDKQPEDFKPIMIVDGMEE